jgi:ribosome-associated translation inhibitor RaiA
MKTPLQVTFRNMTPSPTVESKIRERAEQLDRLCNSIMSCRVVVEQSHRHHHQGNLFHVRVDLKVPDAELVASREPSQHHAHEDAYVAVRDAFDEIRRQLEDYMRRRRAEVKTHAVPQHGHVTKLHADHGTLETADGKEVYFHRNCVIDADFDAIRLGDELRFTEAADESGVRASTVHLIGKHHVVG